MPDNNLRTRHHLHLQPSRPINHKPSPSLPPPPHQFTRKYSTETTSPPPSPDRPTNNAPNAMNPPRPSRPAREVTPPSPPNSVLIGENGEVRVQIKPWPITDEVERSTQKHDNRDSSSKYYNYYTRSASPSSEAQREEEDEGEVDIAEMTQRLSKFLTPVELDLPVQHPGPVARLERHATTRTQGSGISDERRDAENVAMRLRDEGFYFDSEVDDDGSEIGSGMGMMGRRPPLGVGRGCESDTTSAKASSTALVRGMTVSTTGSEKERPGMGRWNSNSSGERGGGVQTQRLSRISAGSGVSGVAILVTADGAASMRGAGEDIPLTERTHAGGGRDKVPNGESGAYEDRETPGRDIYDGASMHESDTSGESEEKSGDEEDLIRGPSPMTGKLPAQHAPNGTSIHPADPRYEHTYHYRQTSSTTPSEILIPTYRFSTSSFPHHNTSLPLPLPSTPTTTPILRRPPSAVLRSPLRETFLGDAPADTRPPSILWSHGQPTNPAFTFPASASSPHLILTPAPNSRPLSPPNEINRHSLHPPESAHSAGAESQRALTPQPASKRSSWLRDALPSFRREGPKRPSFLLRRSLTPHLINPRDIEALADGGEEGVKEREREQRRVGLWVVTGSCLFPPLLCVVAAGGMDGVVRACTNGRVREVGGREKKVAAWVGGGLCLGVVVAVAVGVGVVVAGG